MLTIELHDPSPSHHGDIVVHFRPLDDLIGGVAHDQVSRVVCELRLDLAVEPLGRLLDPCHLFRVEGGRGWDGEHKLLAGRGRSQISDRRLQQFGLRYIALGRGQGRADRLRPGAVTRTD